MSDADLRERFQAVTEAAQRANGFVRAAPIVAVMTLAVGVLGLGLPLR